MMNDELMDGWVNGWMHVYICIYMGGEMCFIYVLDEYVYG